MTRRFFYILPLLALLIPSVLHAALPVETYDESTGTLWETLTYRANVAPFNVIALLIFVLAITHTFFTSRFTALAHRIERRRMEESLREEGSYLKERDQSFLSEVFFFLGEVEIVFGLWAIPLVGAISAFYSWEDAVTYLETRNYTEPMFVIVIMAVASTRPFMSVVERSISAVARLGGGGARAWWISLLTIGPLLGSFITEPGAMTVTAILLGKQFYSKGPSRKFAYATIGLLFVNVSVGGALTRFAAPPILIVADRWGWTTPYVFTHFGWKVMIGVIVSNLVYLTAFRKEFARLERPNRVAAAKAAAIGDEAERPVPAWISAVHILILIGIDYFSHDPVVFIGLFLLFLGFYQATSPHQGPLNLRAPLLVGLFLAALVIHGGLQTWWISPILAHFSALPLMLIATLLTTVNDNAAITYLSSLSPNFPAALRYSVMAGALTGGGLTVIANAPNPAGQQILGRFFKDGVSPLRLFLGALIPTIIMGLAFIFLYSSHMFAGA